MLEILEAWSPSVRTAKETVRDQMIHIEMTEDGSSNTGGRLIYTNIYANSTVLHEHGIEISKY